MPFLILVNIGPQLALSQNHAVLQIQNAIAPPGGTHVMGDHHNALSLLV